MRYENWTSTPEGRLDLARKRDAAVARRLALLEWKLDAAREFSGLAASRGDRATFASMEGMARDAEARLETQRAWARAAAALEAAGADTAFLGLLDPDALEALPPEAFDAARRACPGLVLPGRRDVRKPVPVKASRGDVMGPKEVRNTDEMPATETIPEGKRETNANTGPATEARPEKEKARTRQTPETGTAAVVAATAGKAAEIGAATRPDAPIPEHAAPHAESPARPHVTVSARPVPRAASAKTDRVAAPAAARSESAEQPATPAQRTSADYRTATPSQFSTTEAPRAATAPALPSPSPTMPPRDADMARSRTLTVPEIPAETRRAAKTAKPRDASDNPTRETIAKNPSAPAAPSPRERPRTTADKPDAAAVIDYDIRRVAKGKAPFTGEQVVRAARKHGVEPEMLAAFARNDSAYGTRGHGSRNHNPCNVGQFDGKKKPVKGYATWDEGLEAGARNLASRIRSYRETTGRDDWGARELATGRTLDGKPYFKGAYMTDPAGPGTVATIYRQLSSGDIKGAPWNRTAAA